MSVVIVTGSSGLIGSETVRYFSSKGMDVIGIDNNLREYFFGSDGATDWNANKLKREVKNYTHHNLDIRNNDVILNIFKKYSNSISLVVHCAAQPSHDWAAKEPLTDFSINATGTLNLLESTRLHAPNSVFIFTSTNKVYGDTPNKLPLIEEELRWSCDKKHPFGMNGIDESMSIDNSKHSIFGASKVAADILCQEYGKYFGMKTGVFRGGCLTGPSHSGAELHGFLSYLIKCQLSGKKYTIYGYKGKQVRDNIHSSDLVSAFWNFYEKPKMGTAYNIGGGIHSNISMLEAINLIEKISGKALNYEVSDVPREGDHQWWVSDVRKFQNDYPEWRYEYDIERIIREIIQSMLEITTK